MHSSTKAIKVWGSRVIELVLPQCVHENLSMARSPQNPIIQAY